MKSVTPSPCTIMRPDQSGQLVVAEVITRDPVPVSYWTPDKTAYRYRVMAEQETGEEMFVGHAATLRKAEAMASSWMNSHPEHRRAWLEKL